MSSFGKMYKCLECGEGNHIPNLCWLCNYAEPEVVLIDVTSISIRRHRGDLEIEVTGNFVFREFYKWEFDGFYGAGEDEFEETLKIDPSNQSERWLKIINYLARNSFGNFNYDEGQYRPTSPKSLDELMNITKTIKHLFGISELNRW